jgi:hypothetical protein
MVEYNFVITTPLEIEESFTDRAILSGIVLKLDSATKNGNVYQIEEAEQIANELVGMPVFFGVKPPQLVNTPQGLAMVVGKHDKNLDSPEIAIGRVFKTVHDKTEKVIKAWIEVWNNSKFPDLVQKIKKGWGFSIGGRAMQFEPMGTLNSVGRAVKKIFGMHPNHLQLLEPDTPRGQDIAKVEDVKAVEESLSFDPCPWGACEVSAPTINNTTTENTTITPIIHKTPVKVIRTTKRVIFLDDAYVV